MFMKKDTIKSVMDASPRAPNCIKSIIIHFPKSVKLLSGTVNNPVTQVADVAVNIRSIVERGILRDKGSARSSVPSRVSKKNEKNIICAGESVEIIFFSI
jgi:hypothetical protein